MIHLPWLSLMFFLPLLGAGAILLIKGQGTQQNARWVALWTSFAVLAMALTLWVNFDEGLSSFQFVESYAWFPGWSIQYYVGIDGISLPFILLTAFLVPICILASWTAIQDRVHEYMACFLVLETFVLGMFCALDFVLFYLFFEGVLIPMFLIIGIWGGARRVYAAFKFFLYTFFGSVFMLIALVIVYHQVGSTSLPLALQHTFDPQLQYWLFMAFCLSFAVKIPMWPFHTWLPDAHVEAPTGGSVILAGILLKMGGYGFIRFAIPLFPVAAKVFAPLIFTLSLIAIIYTSLVALVQEDMKKLIAYSSVAHMGYVTLGLFTFTEEGIQGAMVQMVSHGLISGALFMVVGVIYERLHTREIAKLGGLAGPMPLYATFFMFFTLASVGLPGTSGFVGEFLVLLGAYETHSLLGVLAATGMVLGAAYALLLYRRVSFEKLKDKSHGLLRDLSPREIAMFVPLGVLVLFLGLYPRPLTSLMTSSIQHLLIRHSASIDKQSFALQEIR